MKKGQRVFCGLFKRNIVREAAGSFVGSMGQSCSQARNVVLSDRGVRRRAYQTQCCGDLN